MEYIWILFFLLMIQPVIQQRLLLYLRQSLIETIERKRNSRVILIIHRQEMISFLGLPIYRYLTMEDSEAVLRALALTPEEKDIDLVLHTPGGLVLAATQIARAMKQRKGKVRVIIPHYAMSGGTLIALAADEIIMSQNAVLGPLDPQLGGFPAPSLLRLKSIKDTNRINDEFLVMADMAAKAINQLKETIIELVIDKMGEEKAKQLASQLTEGHWTHDYPITSEKAKEMGLPVSTDVPQEFLRLMSLYRQPVQKQSSVEYLQQDSLLRRIHPTL